MQTCKICNYTLTIGKIHTSDNINKIINPINFINIFIHTLKSDIDMVIDLTFDIKDLMIELQKQNIKDETYKLLIHKYNTIKKYSKLNTFCLKCTQCNEIFILTQRILLSTKLKKTSKKINLIDVSEIITDYTLPRTKDFICPNKDCNPDPILKEAVIYKPILNEHNTYYVCVTCQTIT